MPLKMKSSLKGFIAQRLLIRALNHHKYQLWQNDGFNDKMLAENLKTIRIHLQEASF